jgi:hypothetical protein
LISGGVLILSFCFGFELFFSILVGFAAFHGFCWLLLFSFFYMTFLSFSLAFSLLAMLHGVLNSNFKLYAFVVNGLIK